MTRTTNPNLKVFSGIKMIKGVFFIKTLDCFQANVRFSILVHILNLKYCCVFETKLTFPFLSIILNSEQDSL